MTDSTLEVLFLWHLHQPHYGRPGETEYLLPWTRLHAVRAYYDMARHLEESPSIRGTFNFSGSLLQQLSKISDQGWRDRWWRWCQCPPQDLDMATRLEIVRHFFSINFERGIAPLPRYADLWRHREDDGIGRCARRFSSQDLLDLQVLFNLAWCGHFAAADFPLIADLRAKGRDFTIDDRQALLDLHLEILQRVLPLYRKLADRGQVEISVSPMYHPIVPLLIDSESAAVATPDRPRPRPYRAPDHAAAHLQEARELARSIFGHPPAGIWPSEGSVSPAAYDLFADGDVEWIATDEAILAHSLGDRFERDQHLWRPWTFGHHRAPKIFFRDRWLSDQVGFVYSSNPPDKAAQDLIGHLQNIRHSLSDATGAVAIILDGENPWEHYEDSGYHFLRSLYRGLATAPGLTTTVFSDVSPEPGVLEHLHSGSWIMGNFQIWIGHAETNAAWEWIRQAHELIAKKAEADGDEHCLEQAREYLRIAQGSDWFWWYGDDFSSEQDAQFDALFRSFIIAIWEELGEVPPPSLTTPIFDHHLSAEEQEAQINAPTQSISPTIDGRPHQDWDGAGQILLSGAHGSMFENFSPLQKILFGFSHQDLYLRCYPGDDFGDTFYFLLHITNPQSGSHRQLPLRPGTPAQPQEGATIAFDELADVALSLASIDVSPGQTLTFYLEVYRKDLMVYRFPHHQSFNLTVPGD